MSQELLYYKSRAVRALVLLHERYMREFLADWKAAKAHGVTLPATEDPDYQSLEHILRHVLRAGRGYMTWMCGALKFPDPQIDPPPEIEQVREEAGDYLEYLLKKWRESLAEMSDEQTEFVAKSRWNVDYCIDAMLEHAVMHPLRHSFQLKELMNA